MKICYFDAFSGISGDMTVAALVDAGAPPEPLLEGLRSLGTGAELRLERVKRKGISALKFHVEGGEQKSHRHLPQIIRMIEGSTIPDGAKERAARVFQRLAEAESASHGTPLEKVHFHEVGAVDSICDVVGACLALDSLGIERIWCSEVNTGAGVVETQHGLLPVPAPATGRLLQGIPIYARGPRKELTTPTGAAIVAALAEGFGPLPPMVLRSCGFGAGDMDFPEHANLLRVLIGDAQPARG